MKLNKTNIIMMLSLILLCYLSFVHVLILIVFAALHPMIWFYYVMMYMYINMLIKQQSEGLLPRCLNHSSNTIVMAR